MTKIAIAFVSAFLAGICIVPCLAQEKPNIAMQDAMAIRRQLMGCWHAPNLKEPVRVSFAVKLKRDGMFDGEPKVLSDAKDEISRQILESAVKALAACQPFKLPESSYDSWKELTIDFAIPDESGRRP